MAFLFGAEPLLTVRTPRLILTVKGKKSQNGAKIRRTYPTISSVTGKVPAEAQIAAAGVLLQNGQKAAPPLFFANERYTVTVRGARTDAIALTVNGVPVWETFVVTRVGYFDLTVTIDGAPYLSLRTEAFPARVTYRTDAEIMRRELTDAALRAGMAAWRHDPPRVAASSQRAFLDAWRAEIDALTRAMQPRFAEAARSARSFAPYAAKAPAPALSTAAIQRVAAHFATGKFGSEWVVLATRTYRFLQDFSRLSAVALTKTPRNRAGSAVPYARVRRLSAGFAACEALLFDLPAEAVETLYARWCFLQLAARLGERYLPRGAQHGDTVRFSHPVTGHVVTLSHVAGKEDVFLLSGVGETGDAQITVFARYLGGAAPYVGARRAVQFSPKEMIQSETVRENGSLLSVPLAPGETADLAAWLADATDVPPRPPAAETAVDWQTADVLVGSLRTEAQYRINLTQKFYFTPWENIDPADPPVRFVALYRRQSWKNAGVVCFGEVTQTALVKRREIPVPMRKNSGEYSYYRYRIKRWIPLPAPVLPKSEGVYVPRRTNLFLLTHCRFSYELFHIGSAAEYRLALFLRTLREKGAENMREMTKNLDRTHRLSVRNGRLLLQTHDYIVCAVPLTEAARAPVKTLDLLRGLLEKRE